MTDLEHNVLVNMIAEYGADAIIERVNDIVADRDEICGQCNDPHCDGCVPFDTPSLDTSFHDHEMDV